jgi:hypothetical protein
MSFSAANSSSKEGMFFKLYQCTNVFLPFEVSELVLSDLKSLKVRVAFEKLGRFDEIVAEIEFLEAGHMNWVEPLFN